MGGGVILYYGGRPEHCKMLSSILVLYPLDANSASPLAVTTKRVPQALPVSHGEPLVWTSWFLSTVQK